MNSFQHKLFAILITALFFFFLAVDVTIIFRPVNRLISPLVNALNPLHPLSEGKEGKEVFGFAPYWTFRQLDNVNFDVLTTMAYFGIPVDAEGNLVLNDPGYETFKSNYATEIFQKAHNAGTRVVLTITQMNNETIEAFVADEAAQENAITQTVDLVQKRGIDGINVDFEYLGDPGPEFRQKFSRFVSRITARMHEVEPASKVTVSVYASAVKNPKIYDINALANGSDGIFMMAYDFATTGADNAMPTSPLYGYKNGTYWYDVSTAVDDFLTQMPADKLILGVPWYGYNYLVYEPAVKAETRPYYSWRGSPYAQTYSLASAIKPETEGVSTYKTGWDDEGKVGWKAYYLPDSGTWRMIFVEDERSLGIKYDFVKQKKLAGVGIWALGFDDGHSEMWTTLAEKFGMKLADNNVLTKIINEQI